MGLCFKIVFLTLFLNIVIVNAQHGDVVRIKEISTSKKSLIVDNGKFEGVTIGTKGKLYFVDKTAGFDKPSYVFIADGEAIKVHNNHSYWFLKNIENYSLIEKGREIVIFRITTDKRRNLKVRQTHKVSQSQDKDVRGQSVPEDLVFLEDQFRSSSKLFESYPTREQDIESVENAKFNGAGEEYDEKFNEVKKIKYIPPRKFDKKVSEIKKKKELEVFDLTTKGSTDKINNLKNGIYSLYQGQERSGDVGRDKNDLPSIYEKIRDEEIAKAEISPRAVAKLKQEGPLFSSGLTDDQLREFYIRSGIEKELRRQKEVLEEKASHEINIRYATGISDHSTTDDPNHQSADYSISVGYEFHLANSLESLENFTIELTLEQGVGHYDLGGVNGRFTEAAIKGHANWYFWNSPSKLNKYLPYVGVGFKRGNADVTSFALSSDYSFSYVGLPSFHTGIKYRFKAGDTVDDWVKIGFGLNFMISQEATTYSIIDTVSSEDNINSQFSISQTKMLVGVNLYF